MSTEPAPAPGSGPTPSPDPSLGPAATPSKALPIAAARVARRTWITLVGAFALAFFGYLSGVGLHKSGHLPKLSNATPEQMRQEMREIVDRPAGESLLSIYRNNLTTFVILCLGFATAGILTGVQLFWLGFSVGWIVTHRLAEGLDGRLVFWFLFPHGLPEVAAFVLAGSVGLHGTWVFVRYLRGGTLVLSGEAQPLLFRAGLGFALLLLAGLIEVFVTPALGRQYL